MRLLTKIVTALGSAVGLTLRDERLYRALGTNGDSYAGKVVTIDGALQIDTVWACVRLLAQTIATLPLQTYRRDASGKAAMAPDHPLYRLLHTQPNADMTASEFWEAICGCLFLWGNAYAEIVRGVDDRVVALLPMRPDRVIRKRLSDGSIVYRYIYLGKTIELLDDQVLHIKGFSLDGELGLSPVGQARHNLGSAMAAEEVSGSIFRNGMRPSGYLYTDTKLTADQRKDAQAILDKFKGAHATGSVPLLEFGWKFEALEIPAEDAQLLQTRSFQVEQLCRWFGVPPIMIGHMEKSTAWGSGLEQMNLWFLTYGLRTHLKRIEHAIQRSIVPLAEQNTVYTEFNVEGLLRADSTARAALYGVYAQNGLRTRNELRALDNLPPLPGGDDLTVQSNLLPIEKLGQQPAAPDAHAQAEAQQKELAALTDKKPKKEPA